MPENRTTSGRSIRKSTVPRCKRHDLGKPEVRLDSALGASEFSVMNNQSSLRGYRWEAFSSTVKTLLGRWSVMVSGGPIIPTDGRGHALQGMVGGGRAKCTRGVT